MWSWLQVGDDLNPIRVLALFSAITDEACELLDLAGRPEHLIMTHLPVPPVCIRPSVEMDSGGGTNEDDITMKLMVRPHTKYCAYGIYLTYCWRTTGWLSERSALRDFWGYMLLTTGWQRF